MRDAKKINEYSIVERLVTGVVIGNQYQLESVIESGQFGQVFRVNDLSQLTKSD